MTRIPYRVYHNKGVSVQSLFFNVGTNDGVYLFCTYPYSNPPSSFLGLCVGIIGLGEGNIGFRRILTPDSSGYNVTSVTFSNGVISLNYDSPQSVIGHVFELTTRYTG